MGYCKYYRLDDLSNRNVFLTLLDARSPVSTWQQCGLHSETSFLDKYTATLSLCDPMISSVVHALHGSWKADERLESSLFYIFLKGY